MGQRRASEQVAWRDRKGRGWVVFGLALLLVLAATGGVVGVGVWWHGTDRLLDQGAAFERQPLFETYFLYDLGLADVNDDGRLDVFTTNHSAAQQLRLGQPDGGFGANFLADAGLDQTPEFPGFAATAALREREAAGLFVDYHRSALVLRSRVAGEVGRGQGEVRFPWSATVVATGGMSFDLESERLEGGAVRTRIAFTSAGEGSLVIEPQPAPSDGFPITVALTAGFAADDIHVGVEGVHPGGTRLVLTPKDRHGMAWADWDGDREIDVFIARGGLQGLGALIDDLTDELLTGKGGRFTQVPDQAGIDKGGCSGRRAAWVDVDRDNRLDLYLSCGRTSGQGQRNRLYRQRADRTFVEVADEFGVAIEGYGTFVWLDVDEDGYPDLVWADEHEFVLYRNQGGSSFVREPLGDAPGRATRLRNLAVGDFDRDGDLDLFAASRSGNALLINEAGRLRLAHDLGELGLPAASYTATWIDFDNDGRLDLATLPGGIYRQTAAGRFEATGLLASDAPLLTNDARASWFDADLDGALDAVIATRPCWPGRVCAAEEKALSLARRWFQQLLRLPPPAMLQESKRWLVDFYRGRPNDNHWLAVDLIGPPGNHQSIGGRVALTTSAGCTVGAVGQLEGAHMSQGNYRLHFGLGPAPGVVTLEATWPDGRRVVLEAPPVDRLIQIAHPDARAGT